MNRIVFKNRPKKAVPLGDVSPNLQHMSVDASLFMTIDPSL